MCKEGAIRRALHVCTPLLVLSCNAVATSSADIEAIDFLSLTNFTSKGPVSTNFLIVYFRPLADIRPQPFFPCSLWQNFFIAARAQSPFLKKNFTSKAPSLIEWLVTSLLRWNMKRMSRGTCFYNKWYECLLICIVYHFQRHLLVQFGAFFPGTILFTLPSSIFSSNWKSFWFSLEVIQQFLQHFESGT